MNLFFHHHDRGGITADWNFFGTSHGKNICDGIGGTVKRLLTKASLQGNMLNSLEEIYQFCTKNIKGIE